MKPRLTNKVLRGLVDLVAKYEASPSDHLDVNELDDLDRKGRQRMSDIDRACEWVWSMINDRNNQQPGT